MVVVLAFLLPWIAALVLYAAGRLWMHRGNKELDGIYARWTVATGAETDGWNLAAGDLRTLTTRLPLS